MKVILTPLVLVMIPIACIVVAFNVAKAFIEDKL